MGSGEFAFVRHFEAPTDQNTTRVRISSFGLVIRRRPRTTREPDLAVFEKAKMVEIDGYFHSAPGLLVEVLSPGNTRAERDEKIRDYESLGVPELWVVSTGKRTVEIMQLTPAQKLEKIAIANRGQIRPKLFPQAVVKIAAILAWLTAFSPNIRD